MHSAAAVRVGVARVEREQGPVVEATQRLPEPGGESPGGVGHAVLLVVLRTPASLRAAVALCACIQCSESIYWIVPDRSVSRGTHATGAVGRGRGFWGVLSEKRRKVGSYRAPGPARIIGSGAWQGCA